MNNADKHITPWSNADVQKYLNGELSAREMHDLEQQALDDPFLADALEGLQTQPVETLNQDLSELRTRLDNRVTKRSRVIPWPFLRVAAAVILLAGIGFIGFYTTHRSSPEIARSPVIQTPPVVANPPSVQDTTTPATTFKTAPVAASQAPPVANAPEEKRVAKRASPRPSASPIQRPQAATSTYADLSDSITFRDTAPGRINDAIVERNLQSDVLKKSVLRSTFGYSGNLVAFSGRVLDLNHRPVAGAYLSYKSTFSGTVTGAVTDDKGQFNLYVPQKDSTRQLTVARVGYEDVQYALNTEDRTGNTIYLKQDPAQLDEVVVSGVGAKRKEYFAEPPSDAPEKLDSFWLTAEPTLGRVSYLDYLATAKKTIPVDTTLHGIESISFLVDKKGALTEFRIERSLSPAHDAGVIRLITEGPTWRMLHGRKARVLVNVLF
jgi:hypothetical protein